MIISDKKYACETCIKGHRSSSCKHFDRPLFEIKKKGRPITQCEHCRELRKTKQVHVKCICEGKADPAAASAKKGSKLGLESAAFPNGLPVQQAMGTLVALPAPPSGSAGPDSLENNDGGCVCASGGSCHCCVPKKTHRRSRTTSGQPSQQSDRVLARIAELRPVLPAPSPEYFLYGSGGHDLTLSASPTTTTAATGTLHHLNHSNHLHPRHHENVYSPYGRAYDAHHPHPSYDVASADRGRMSLSPAQETPTTATTTFCDCGEGCLCHGCGTAAGGAAGAGCTNPEGCNACLGCTLNALQPLFHPSASDQSSQESIDEWLRSLGQQQNDGTATAAAADLGHGLPWDRDMITGMVSADGSVKTSSTTTNATTTTTNTNGGGNTGSEDYSSIHFPSVEEVVDFGSPSYFRLSRSSSHGSSSAWHPYMDPSFLQSLRFGIEPAPSPSPVGLRLNHAPPHLGHQVQQQQGVGGEPLRPRSHSPAGTTTTGTGEGTVGLNLGMANLHVSQPVPGFGVANSNHGIRQQQQQMYNVNMAGGMRSAPQLNVNVSLGQGYHCGSYGVGIGGGGGGGGVSDGSSDGSIRDNRSTANY